MSAIVWLRRELRLHDNPPLCAALKRHEQVVVAFCLDPALLRGRNASPRRTQFMLECLADLDDSLRARGSALVLLRGAPERELPALAARLGASELFTTSDASPYAAARDARVAQALRASTVAVSLQPAPFVLDSPAALHTAAGTPYTVFTPYYRSWLSAPRRAVLDAPRAMAPLPSACEPGRVPTLAELGLTQPAGSDTRGGERAARSAMARFLRDAVDGYDAGRDELARTHCSGLSAHLHFGTISPRELEQRLPGGPGAQAFRRQLCWRDFFAQVLVHFPQDAVSEHQARYRGTIQWSTRRDHLEAWQRGATGYPLVDAAMRQLALEGWMHNRARLVVGSFLTKHLGIDWREGERWFMRELIDGDMASNNGNWQWIASVGVDPQPVFRRILSPARQQQRFDPDGAYVRRHVPQLRDVPDRYLPEPALMPAAVQRDARCRVGSDYPQPIVDHALARAAALARYAQAARGGR